MNPGVSEDGSSNQKTQAVTGRFEQSLLDEWIEPLRIAIVLLKLNHDTVSDDMLEGLGRTFSQLARLGLNPIVVLQLERSPPGEKRHVEIREQAARVTRAIEKTTGQRAQSVESVFGDTNAQGDTTPSNHPYQPTQTVYRATVMKSLSRGIIPVVAPLAFDHKQGRIQEVPAFDAVLTLSRDLLCLSSGSRDEASESDLLSRLSLDRLIILDSCGGLPWSGRSSGSHVSVNLQQEHDAIRDELEISNAPEEVRRAHIENLRLAKEALALLSPASSVVISTPTAAAASFPRASPNGTSSRNPLIHNILTDKPLYSSSLPQSRFGATHDSSSSQLTSTTLLKWGMPVKILPSPQKTVWSSPSPTNPPLSLSSPDLDMSKLIDLIEDSFQRPLDSAAYFTRIAPILAGIIVAGDYDGCAILTWEPVPHVTDAVSSTCDQQHTSLPVPYLDKFAVRRSSQGAGGIADFIFNAMVRDCFPHGVVWRSRTKNPVNGWYFERASGSWRLPDRIAGTHFTMFWTGDVDGRRFGDYAAVCNGLGSYFRDGKGGE